MGKIQSSKIEITAGTIIKSMSLVIAIFLLFKIWPVIASLFLAVVIAAAFEPTLRWLESKKIPRIVSVPSIYVIFLGAFLGVFYAILPSIFNEIYLLSQSLPEKYESIAQEFLGSGTLDNFSFLIPSMDQFIFGIQDQMSQLIPTLFGFITSMFGGVISFLLIIAFSFYLSLGKNDIEKAIIFLVPEKHSEYTLSLFHRIQRRTGRWLQASFILATLMGVSTFVVMKLIGVNFALTLGITAGLLEIIPFVGPFIAAIFIFVVASSQSLELGFLALFLFVLLQQLEQIIVIPSVMSRAVGVSPVAVLLAIIAGAKLAGFWGIIVSIPLTAALVEVMHDIKNKRIL